MMRTLFVNGRFLGGATTAVNAVARDLTLALYENPGDWSVTLAVPRDLADAAEETGLPVRVVGNQNGPAWDQVDLPAMRAEGVVAGFFNTVPLRGRGYVTLLHDAQVFTAAKSYDWATRTWRRLLSRRATSKGNYVLTVSEHSKRALIDLGLGSDARIGVVPNGLGASGFRTGEADLLQRLALTPDGYCVALSSLMPHKNIAFLMEVFSDPALSHMRLVLIGATGRAEFEAAGFALPPNVRFSGYLSDADLAGLYAGALGVLMPSRTEGFGLPALEGMAHGAVALVSDRAALPEVVGEAGVVLPIDAPGAWVREITGLRADAKRRAFLARAGRARASRFTWDAAATAARGHLDRWFADAARPVR